MACIDLDQHWKGTIAWKLQAGLVGFLKQYVKSLACGMRPDAPYLLHMQIVLWTCNAHIPLCSECCAAGSFHDHQAESTSSIGQGGRPSRAVTRSRGEPAVQGGLRSSLSSMSGVSAAQDLLVSANVSNHISFTNAARFLAAPGVCTNHHPAFWTVHVFLSTSLTGGRWQHLNDETETSMQPIDPYQAQPTLRFFQSLKNHMCICEKVADACARLVQRMLHAVTSL